MPLVDSARGSIYYAYHRREQGRLPVVFVHGAAGSHLDWPAALRRLPDANGLFLDLPGHGKSPGPGHNRIIDYAADVIALLDALNVQQAIFAGHSMGGGISQWLALEYPDRTAGLILMGTGAKLSVHTNILDRVLTNRSEVGALLADWMWSEAIPANVRQISARQVEHLPVEITYGDYLACNTFDVRDRLGEIQVPALVIGGTADRMTAYKYSEYLCQHIPNAELFTVADAGHMMTLEQPNVVAGAVGDWLRLHFPPVDNQ
jgi:pimeloyl-ACP methyl ester carboxylesterase